MHWISPTWESINLCDIYSSKEPYQIGETGHQLAMAYWPVGSGNSNQYRVGGGQSCGTDVLFSS